MRILIVSEGESELGRANHAGALEILVSRLRAPETLEFGSITVRHPGLGKVHAKGAGGMEKKAIACLRFAQRHGFEAVVLVIDQDAERFGHRRLELSKAQDSPLFSGIRRAMAAAVLTFDAWILADEVALSSAMGATIQAQPDPEQLADAKGHCRALRENHGCVMGMAEFYALVARNARLNVWEKRCPSGFAVFSARVRGM